METLLAEREDKIWDFPTILPRDDSITSKEYIKIYEETHGTGDMSTATEFAFTTKNEDIWLLPSESYLKVDIEIRRKVADANDSFAFTAGDTNLCQNAFNIFKEAKYFINDKKIEEIDYLGIATMINRLINVTDVSELESIKHNELWLSNADRQAHINGTTFNVKLMLPLKKIFTFCDNINHVFRGVKHRIVLKLNDSNSLLNKAVGKPDGTVTVSKMVWHIPKVEPSLTTMAKLETQLASNSSYSLSWPAISVYRIHGNKQSQIRESLSSHIHKPEHVFIMCQKAARTKNQSNMDMVFDDMTVKSCQVEVNGTKFPESPIEADFTAATLDVRDIHDRFLQICKNNKSTIDMNEFKNRYPIWHIDVSKHKPELYDNTNYPEIVVNMEFKTVPTEDYYLWIVIVNARTAVLNLDQKKMRVID